jgi:hypothetical protein
MQQQELGSHENEENTGGFMLDSALRYLQVIETYMHVEYGGKGDVEIIDGEDA